MSLFTLKNLKKAWKRLHSNETAVIAVLSLAIATTFAASSSLAASATGHSMHRAAPSMTHVKRHPVRPVVTRTQKKPVMIRKEMRRAASSSSSVSDAE